MIENKQNTVVIYGPFRFPFGDAAANRVWGLARAIIEAGWNVFVVGRGQGRAEDRQANGTYRVGDVPYATISVPGESKASRIVKLLSGGKSYERTWTEHGVTRPYAIVSYGNYLAGNYRVTRSAAQASVKFIVDVVEWYSAAEFRRGIFSSLYIDNQLGLRSYRKLQNMIVISRLLEDHFSKTVPNVLRIPPPLDTRVIPYSTERRDAKIKLVYAGSPGRKDYLHLAVAGLAALSAAERERIEFHIYGIQQAQLNELMRQHQFSAPLPENVFAHGYVPHKLAMEALQDADFMVLLRPQMRYANAGFPSKVPESLAVGTPVMLNYTSDLALYIRDGHEGIVVADCSAPAMTAALRRSLALNRDELDAMRLQARQCAEAHFDYRNFVQPLKQLLERAR